MTVAAANVVTVKGPRGSLTQTVHPNMTVVVEDGTRARSRVPTTRGSIAASMGSRVPWWPTWSKVSRRVTRSRLQIIGVGYRAAMKGKDLEVQAGYSHPVMVPVPDGIEFEVPTPTQIVVRGNDKQAVGEIAAKIRKIRKPEPYKGKGIRYEGEYVRKKAGKAAKTGAA